MIRSFRHKGLQELEKSGRSAKIDVRMHKRVLSIIDALAIASAPEEMNIPGLNFHSLRGFSPMRYTVHVNGPWCITFEFDGPHAAKVDFEQYH